MGLIHISSQSIGELQHSVYEERPYDLVVKNIGKIVTFGPNVPAVGEEMREPRVIEYGAISAIDGILDFVGSNHELDKSRIGANTTVIDAKGRCVIPGFVDPHTHLVFAGTREFELEMKLSGMSYLEILAKGGGIMHTVQRTRGSPRDSLFGEAWERMNLMLANGTTTAEAKSGYGLDLKTEINILEVIHELSNSHPIDLIPTYLGPHALPPEFKDSDKYLDFVIQDVLPKIKEKRLARFADIFCEDGVFTAAQAERYLIKAKEYGLKPKIHTDEIKNIGGSAVAARVEAISADHLAVTSDEDIELLRKAGVTGVLMPATPFALMANDSEYPRARDMIDAGLTVALGTDLNPNCYSPSMQFTMSLACYKMKMHPLEALAASTINAAHAIGLEDIVGSLYPGKNADIIILNGTDPSIIPYSIGMNSADTVIKAGEVVFSHGHLIE